MHRIEAYFRLAIIFIAIITILYLPIMFKLKKKGKSVIRQLGYVGLIYSTFLIVFATILFVPINFHPEEYILNLNPLNWIGTDESMQHFIVEKVPNIILFIPFGVFLPIVFSKKRSLYKTAIMCFMMTFSVEFIQYFIGRSSDIVDVLTNLLGGIIGYIVFAIADNIFRKNKLWKELLGKKK